MKNKGILIILGLLVVLGFWGCGAYNNLVNVDVETQNSWGNVEAAYQRRTDLYNSVIKTIEGSANFEKSTLTEVIEARAKATQVHVDVNDPKSLEQFQEAQAGLSGAFSRLMAVAEAYPQLQTTTAFRDFQTQIEGTENRINVARQDYNNTIRSYNLKVRQFPSNIFAGVFGFSQKPFYQADPGSEKAPDINFDIK